LFNESILDEHQFNWVGDRVSQVLLFVGGK